MKRVVIFLAEGFEEVEALAPIDLLRRAGYDVTTVSITRDTLVLGSHKIPVKADIIIDDMINEDAYDILILPGGMKGTQNLAGCARVCEMIKKYDADPEKYIAAICAAPAVVLAANGVLKGKKAICYPGNDLIQMMADGGAVMRDDYHKLSAIIDDHIITSKGAGTAMDFALTIIAAVESVSHADVIADKVVYNWDKDKVLGL